MAPREVIVETDQHRRQAVQRRAHDVEAARDRQMRQIQALGAAPRKMRIAPQQRSEEHTSELQSLMRISYDVFCLKKKQNHITLQNQIQYTSNRRHYYIIN